MNHIASTGAYFDVTTLKESIDDLKEFGYLYVIDNTYLFPKIENYDDFFELFHPIESKEELYDILESNEDIRSILLDIIQANHENDVTAQ